MRGRDHGHHRGYTIAPQRVLENARQLRIPVWNVPAHLRLSECCDHVPQRRERLVNTLALFQTLPGRARHPHALRPCQIHEVQLAHFNLFGGLIPHDHARHLLHDDYEHSVRARGHIIHLGRGGGSALRAFLEQ